MYRENFDDVYVIFSPLERFAFTPGAPVDRVCFLPSGRRSDRPPRTDVTPYPPLRTHWLCAKIVKYKIILYRWVTKYYLLPIWEKSSIIKWTGPPRNRPSGHRRRRQTACTDRFRCDLRWCYDSVRSQMIRPTPRLRRRRRPR